MNKNKDKEKAKQIADRMIGLSNESSYNTPDEQRNNVRNVAEQAAISMAEWKDEQFQEERKKWIEKACNYIYNHAHVTTFNDIRLDKCSITQFVDIFKQAMENKQ